MKTFARVLLILIACSTSGLQAQSPFCAAPTTNGPADGDYIARVILGTTPAIDNITTFVPGIDYQDYTLYGNGTVTRLAPGGFYFLTIQAGTFVGDDFAAWIDFDNSGDFDASELVADQFNTSAGQSLLFSFTVPADAHEGYRRMRVRCAFNMVTPDPCGTFDYGETEDYTVLIDDGEPCIPLFSHGNSEGDEITLVSIDGMDYTLANGETGYVDARFFGAAIEVGGGSQVQVVTGSYDQDEVGVWVDWNNDGDWDDPLEEMGTGSSTTAFELFTFALNPPNTILLPRHVVMRVRVSYDSVDPCSDGEYGEVEDYTLAIGHAGLPCLTGISAFEELDAFALARIAYESVSDVDTSDEWPFYTYTPYTPPSFAGVQGAALPYPWELTTRAVGTGVWVLLDVNMDDDFDDPDELLASVVSTSSMQDHALTINIPATCPPGLHHFRVRSFNNANPPPDACAPSIWGGEIFDTHLIVEEPDGPCIPGTLEWTVAGDVLNGIQLNTLDNQNTGAPYGPYYNDYRSMSTDLMVGATYMIEVSPLNLGTTQCGLYIDFNGDGDLDDANENIGNVVAPTYDYYPTFTVPTGLVPGPRLFRIRTAGNDAPLPVSACDPSTRGEVEDYTVYINLNVGVGNNTLADPILRPSADGSGMLLVTDGAWTHATVNVLDPAGRMVARSAIQERTEHIGLHDLAAGIYALTMDLAGAHWSRTFYWPGH